MLDLDTQMELDSFLTTFNEYQKETSLTPVQAVEKQARQLRIRLIEEFKKVAPSAARIDADIQFLHGKMKVRDKFRKEAEQLNGNLAFRHSQGVERKKNGETRSITKRVRRNYQKAYEREISARKRASTYLASTWVNPEHTASKKPRTAKFNHRSGTGSVVSQVRINTEGDEPEIQLRNFVLAVASIGYGRGIIGNALSSATSNMHEYISRKQSEKNAAFNKSP